jgi:hypothetical protein
VKVDVHRNLQVPLDFGAGSRDSHDLLASFTVEFADTPSFANSTFFTVSAMQGSTDYNLQIPDPAFSSNIQIKKGDTYFFRVACSNKVGSSVMSEAVYASAVSLPSPPLNPSSSISGGGVLLSWSLPLDTGVGSNNYALSNYLIEQDTSNFDACPSESQIRCNIQFTVKANQLNYRPERLIPGVQYYFRISAENDAGISLPSATIQVKAVNVPSAPLALAGSWLQAGNVVSLTWSNPLDSGYGMLAPPDSGAINTFQVECSLNSDFGMIISQVVVANSASFRGLDRGNIYFFRVAALNVAGIGLYSDVINVVIDVRPQVVFAYSPQELPQPPPTGWIQSVTSTGGSTLLVVVRDSPSLNASVDRCVVFINNATISIPFFTQIGEGRGGTSLSRTSFNFSVPALPALLQSSTIIATVSFLQQRRQSSNASFKLRYQVVPVPQVTFCIPSIGSVNGGDLFILGIQGFSDQSFASSAQILAIKANGPGSNQSDLSPRILSSSTKGMRTTLWFTVSQTAEGDKSFIVKNQVTSQTVVEYSALRPCKCHVIDVMDTLFFMVILFCSVDI